MWRGLACVGVLLAASTAQAQQADPLAEARAGALECLGPNQIVRTCEGITAYRFLDSGEILADGIMLISAEPHMVVYSTNNVYLRDDQVCGRVSREEIDAMHFAVNGAAAPQELTLMMRDALEQELAGIETLCVRYTADGDALAAAVFADGDLREDMGDRVIWIRPEDGYVLGLNESAGT